MRLVLASASASRRHMLEQAGLTIATRPAAIDEAAVKEAAQADGAKPEDAALLLARLKAERVSAREPDALVIGADQLLVCEGAWFDKPVDAAAARTQLLALRGREHRLVTAVVCIRDGREVWHHVAMPRLTMRGFSEAFLDQYLAAEGDRVLASVGAYRLEGPGAQLFDAIDGDYFSVLGLPLLPLLGFLRQHGALAG